MVPPDALIQTSPLDPSARAASTRLSIFCPAGKQDRLDHVAPFRRFGEDPERAALQRSCQVPHLQAEAHVRLVAAETIHGLAKRQARVGPLDHQPRRPEDLLHDPFHQSEQGLGLGKRQLDIDLRELGLPVGPRILVPEALGDLEVPVVPCDHQELLVNLRRLGQGVEVSRAHPRRDQVLARTLGGAARQDRRLDLQESARVEVAAHGKQDPVPRLDDTLQPRAAQIQVTMAQPHLLRDARLVAQRERQGVRSIQDLEVRGLDFDLPGREARIDVAIGAPHDPAPGGDHIFRPDRLRRRERLGRLLGIEDRLGHTVAIAQVREQQTAVVPDAVDPAQQHHLASGVAGPELATGGRPLEELRCLRHPPSRAISPRRVPRRSAPACRRTCS